MILNQLFFLEVCSSRWGCTWWENIISIFLYTKGGGMIVLALISLLFGGGKRKEEK